MVEEEDGEGGNATGWAFPGDVEMRNTWNLDELMAVDDAADDEDRDSLESKLVVRLHCKHGQRTPPIFCPLAADVI